MKVKTILVTEYHRIGDVIIIAPILKSIRSRFPDAEIILICNESAKKFAEKFNLADKVFGVSVPWTDWKWSAIEWYKIKSFANFLNLLNIDLAIDFKGDLRNLWFFGAHIRKLVLDIIQQVGIILSRTLFLWIKTIINI